MGRSKAWQTALERRLEISRLFALSQDQSDVLFPPRYFSDQEIALRLYMVSLIGHLQGYITDVLNELCDKLPTVWDNSMPLHHKKYVLMQVRRRLSTILEETKDSDIVSMSDINRHHGKFIDCTTWLTAPDQLASSTHREDLKGFLRDNGTKALDKAISVFRMDKMTFWAWLGNGYLRYRGISDLLDSAIQVRNDVAHGSFDHRITLYEARQYTVAVFRLIQKIDEYLKD